MSNAKETSKLCHMYILTFERQKFADQERQTMEIRI